MNAPVKTEMDARALDLIKAKPNLLVSWYLIASYLYHCRDHSLVSDGFYDWLCGELDRRWQWIVHRHKELIDREALRAGTGFYLKQEHYPNVIIGAACALAGIETVLNPFTNPPLQEAAPMAEALPEPVRQELKKQEPAPPPSDQLSMF